VNTLDFLNLVWPTQGIYLVAMPISGINAKTQEPWKGHKYFSFTDAAAAAHQAQLLSNQGIDAYFALGSVKEDLTRTNKDQRKLLGKKIRGRDKDSDYDNTCSLKTLWMDIDVNPNPKKGYPTLEGALTAFRQFCQQMRLPKPMVVISGGGVHAYWVLTEEIDPETWQHYASILKGLTLVWGLVADQSRTADRASVLRPAGTNNYKTGTARPVYVAMAANPVSNHLLFGHLTHLNSTLDLPKAKAVATSPRASAIPGSPLIPITDVSSMNESAATGAGYLPADPRKVITHCRQLSWQLLNPDAVSEPQWYAMVGCMRHAADGYKAVHFLSRKAASYTQNATDQKITQSENAGYPPTTCAKFEMENPGGCHGCPFRGNITTPLQTTRELEPVAAPIIHLQTATGSIAIQMPDPPKPYKRVVSPMTGQARIAITVASEDGDIDVPIYENDLYPERLIYDERLDKYVVVVKSYLAQDGWRSTEIPLGMLYEKRTLMSTLGNAGVMPDLKHVDSVVQYMIAYIRDLQKLAKSSTVYAQLGWRPDMDRFVLPDRVVTPTGSEPANISSNIVNALQWKPACGTLEEWKRIASAYEKPGMEAHQFGFGVGFAAPLFLHTNLTGMVVSMIGERGAGKSSSAFMANSIWGHPKMGWADMEQDSYKAFYNKLGVLHNLPVTYDEHTNLDAKTVSELCLMVSKGLGRARLEERGSAAENYGNWQLMMLMTGNRSLNSRLAAIKVDSSAESARVFEYHVPSNTLPKIEADGYWGVNGAIFRNFGLAGEVYARQLLVSQDWARQRIEFWTHEVDRLGDVSSGERFWSAGVACVLTGFELSNTCGLTNVDIQRLLDFAIRTIRGMRDVVNENTRGPTTILADYLNRNLGGVLIVDAPMQKGAPLPVLSEPRDALKARIEMDSGTLWIDRADFRRFCAKGQIDPADVYQELQAAGVVPRPEERLSLGRGTRHAMGIQSWCWVFDLRHPLLSGVNTLQSVPTNQTSQLPAVTGHLSLVPPTP
jgi:hypothetical protein